MVRRGAQRANGATTALSCPAATIRIARNHPHCAGKFITVEATLLLQAEALSLQMGSRKILHNISLSIAENQIVTLIGPNGAGKTTLVKIVLGLLKADSGKVSRRPALRIGYMPQRLHIEATMPISVRRFLQLAVHARHAMIEKSLAEVGALALLDSQIHALSGGELQRVLLARALIQEPALLVLDEPVQGVDINGQAELYRLITDIRNRHQCGVLMVSHDLHLVMSTTDEVICLNQHICCHGHPEQVSNDPAYLELFGRRQAETLAVYTHHHNHRHDLAGEIIKPGHKHG
ncbi:MAG: zinc ABC transporter ATP-binding protein ZnuC [Pseudomonadales bacterium]|nr:zinc ABC transporter ATP-binding protein ZnuC [Pseudomonadales bacterium]